jgi:sugar lactone lactonase YvrE
VILIAALVGCPPVPVDPCDAIGTADVLCTVAGTGINGFDGDGRQAVDSRLYFPTGVLIDDEGRLVIVDFNNMRVRRRETDGTLVTLAGNGVHGWSEPGAPAAQSPLENPVDAAYGPDGALYVAALHEARVLRVHEGVIQPYAGTGELGWTGDGGPALAATMGEPGGISVSPDGWLFVADTDNHCVRAVDPTGSSIQTLAGDGLAGFVDGVGATARFHRPRRVHADEAYVWVADTDNHAVRRIDRATGEVVTLAGSGVPGFADGASDEARLATPMGLDVRAGEVLFADAGNDALRAIGEDGRIRTLVGGYGEGFVDGPPDEARVAYPYDVAATADGVFVADYRNGAVRLLRP